ncbi:nitroreductase family protein [Desulfotomaculum defluvii]
MNVYEAITNRRSIRKFISRQVPNDIINKLLEAARWAPSGGNIQPWFYYVVKDQAKRQKLAQDALGQQHVSDVPLCIVVCAEPDLSAKRYQERGAELYCLQDTAAAVQNIMLAALEEGLGTCWVGAFNEEKVQETLEMPPGRRPVAIIPIGYPVEVPKSTPRKEVPEISEIV